MKKITLIFIFLVCISLLPVAFIMSEMGPERAWTQISLYLVLYTGFLAGYAGKALRNKYTLYNVLRIYVVIAVLYSSAIGISQIFRVQHYSRAYDNMITSLLNKKDSGKNDLLILEPLPASGWLHSAEIKDDSSHYNNTFLKEFLQLDFDFVAK